MTTTDQINIPPALSQHGAFRQPETADETQRLPAFSSEKGSMNISEFLERFDEMAN